LVRHSSRDELNRAHLFLSIEWNDFQWEVNGIKILPSDSIKVIKTNFPKIDTLVFYDNNSEYSPYTIYLRLNPQNKYILTSALWYKDFNIYRKSAWDEEIYKMYDITETQNRYDSIYYSTIYPEKVKLKVNNFSKGDSLLFFYGHATDYPYFSGQLLTKSNSAWSLPYTDYLESRNYSIYIAKIKSGARIYDREKKNIITVKENDLEIIYKTKIRLFEKEKCIITYNYQTQRVTKIVIK
jgi:hypothetical protein